eukprot:jgi/Tetstr1/425965/TSEL_016315.t1
MAYESKRSRKVRARAAAAAAAAAAASADAGGPRAGHGERAAAGIPPPLPPAALGGRAPRLATQLATVVSLADALTAKFLPTFDRGGPSSNATERPSPPRGAGLADSFLGDESGGEGSGGDGGGDGMDASGSPRVSV